VGNTTRRRILQTMLAGLACTGAWAGTFTKMGPLAQPPEPVVFMLRAVNAKDYRESKHPGLVLDVMGSISDSRLRAKSEKALTAIRTVAPDFDFGRETQAAFRCSDPASICSTFEAITETDNVAIDRRVSALVVANGWKSFRILSLSFDLKHADIMTRATIEEVRWTESDPEFGQPIRAAYLSTVPQEQGKTARDARQKSGLLADYWRQGTPTQLEISLRTALQELEPLLKLALSTGANNNPAIFRPYLESLTQWRHLRSEGVTCDGSLDCVSMVAAVTETRVWWWNLVAMRGGAMGYNPDITKFGPTIVELTSSPLLAIEPQ